MTDLVHELAVEVATVGAYMLGAVALACLAGWALRRTTPTRNP